MRRPARLAAVALLLGAVTALGLVSSVRAASAASCCERVARARPPCCKADLSDRIAKARAGCCTQGELTAAAEAVRAPADPPLAASFVLISMLDRFSVPAWHLALAPRAVRVDRPPKPRSSSTETVVILC